MATQVSSTNHLRNTASCTQNPLKNSSVRNTSQLILSDQQWPETKTTQRHHKTIRRYNIRNNKDEILTNNLKKCAKLVWRKFWYTPTRHKSTSEQTERQSTFMGRINQRQRCQSTLGWQTHSSQLYQRCQQAQKNLESSRDKCKDGSEKKGGYENGTEASLMWIPPTKLGTSQRTNLGSQRIMSVIDYKLLSK